MTLDRLDSEPDAPWEPDELAGELGVLLVDALDELGMVLVLVPLGVVELGMVLVVVPLGVVGVVGPVGVSVELMGPVEAVVVSVLGGVESGMVCVTVLLGVLPVGVPVEGPDESDDEAELDAGVAV